MSQHIRTESGKILAINKTTWLVGFASYILFGKGTGFVVKVATTPGW